jgi:integrase
VADASDNLIKGQEGYERNPEIKRKRYLSGDELKRLTEALAKHPDQTVADIFRLLLLTGARRGEVLGMRWADLDLAAGKWVKPGSTTKQKTEHEVPFSVPVRQLLSGQASAGSPNSYSQAMATKGTWSRSSVHGNRSAGRLGSPGSASTTCATALRVSSPPAAPRCR